MKASILQFTISAVLTLFASSSTFAQEGKASTSSEPAAAVSATEKKQGGRKKKVEMCAECGKPESECECHSSKKDEKKK